MIRSLDTSFGFDASTLSGLRAHLRGQPVRGALGVSLTGFLCASTIALLHVLAGIPYDEVLRDPNAVSIRPFYTGFVSQIGSALWIAAASIALWTGLGLRGDREQRGILIHGGLLAGLLALDDLLMLHEGLFPAAGIPETAVLLVYALLLAGFLVTHAFAILRTAWLYLALGLGCFALSLSVDMLGDAIPAAIFFEDMPKTVGILFWCAYLFTVSSSASRATDVRPAPSAAASRARG